MKGHPTCWFKGKETVRDAAEGCQRVGGSSSSPCLCIMACVEGKIMSSVRAFPTPTASSKGFVEQGQYRSERVAHGAER